VDTFESFVRAGLERRGVPVNDTEIAIMRFVEDVYGPEIQALLAADVSDHWVEPDLDPARAPTS
jgi:hypothetical protein